MKQLESPDRIATEYVAGLISLEKTRRMSFQIASLLLCVTP